MAPGFGSRRGFSLLSRSTSQVRFANYVTCYARQSEKFPSNLRSSHSPLETRFCLQTIYDSRKVGF